MRMIRLVLLAAMGGGLWFIGNYSVILTREGIVVSRKPAFSLEDVFVDVREWDAADYVANSDITRMLIREGYEGLKQKLQDSGEEMRDQINELLESVGR